jgi:hypothetical protein
MVATCVATVAEREEQTRNFAAGYILSMAAKVSDRVQQLVTQAAELAPGELVALAEAI